ENQLRLLERSLRAKGFRWLREPHWNQLTHDLTAVDIRLKFEADIQDLGHLRLDQWINETAFRSNMDRISFSYKDTKGRLRHGKRGVIPDGFLCIIDQKRQSKGLPAKANFLLEVDLATHSNPNFSMEKAAAGAAYIKSQEFKTRFGSNSGRWLIITTSEVRMRHLMEHTHERIGTKSNLFLFTTLSEFFSKNGFTEAIWSVCGQNRKQKLLTE
ncbi:MAG: replication-relaxation family protein, partial [Anaerolineaceae bacterium]|nr:replication-relaxation family protein [Anaerolineaceae bacterium]